MRLIRWLKRLFSRGNDEELFAWYDESGNFCVDVQGLLRETGLEDTADNREYAVKVLTKVARERWPDRDPEIKVLDDV